MVGLHFIVVADIDIAIAIATAICTYITVAVAATTIGDVSSLVIRGPLLSCMIISAIVDVAVAGVAAIGNTAIAMELRRVHGRYLWVINHRIRVEWTNGCGRGR